MTLFFLMAFACAATSSCTTGRIMVTGKQRPAIQPEAVRVYSGLPAGCEKVAIVMVETGGKDQASLDRATKVGKEKAASIGANGIVPHMGSAETLLIDYVPLHKTHFTFEAIYVESDR